MSEPKCEVQFVLPPPPYTLPDASISIPTTNQPSASTSDSTHSTPLPSYTSSPILQPILTTLQLLHSTHPPPLKLSTPQPCSAKRSLGEITVRASASVLIAVLGSSVVDAIWLTMLNIIGFGFTLTQIPLAIMLARQFNKPPTTKHQPPTPENTILPLPHTKPQTNPVPTPTPAQACIRHLTQLMWDWHDELELAELHPPSTWGRH